MDANITYIVIERDNCSASFGDVTILTSTKQQLHDILERLGAFATNSEEERTGEGCREDTAGGTPAGQ